MLTSNKSMLVIMGICIGLIFFGINIALINFNRLVAPEQPIELITWHTACEEMEVTFLGETIHLSLDKKWPDSTWLDSAWPEKVSERAVELYRFGRDEISHRLAPVQQKVREAISRYK